jgi:hypothetical protein
MENAYPINMARRVLRRWFALLAVMALISGLAAHGVAAGDMSAKMMGMATASEMSPSSTCNGCGGGDDGMPATACNAVCSGIVAVLPDLAPVAMAAVEPAAPIAVASHLGRDGSPDPYPPKSSVLN